MPVHLNEDIGAVVEREHRLRRHTKDAVEILERVLGPPALREREAAIDQRVLVLRLQRYRPRQNVDRLGVALELEEHVAVGGEDFRGLRAELGRECQVLRRLVEMPELALDRAEHEKGVDMRRRAREHGAADFRCPGEIAGLRERMRPLHRFGGNFGGVLHRRYVKGGADGAPEFRHWGSVPLGNW